MKNGGWPSKYKLMQLASKRPCIIAGFNVFSSDDAGAVVAAAQKVKAPVCLMINRQAAGVMSVEQWAEVLRSHSKRAEVPVYVHLDHTTDLNIIKRACRAGFDSVMFDGSQLSLEENIRQTKAAAKIAHAAGVLLEAEIGAVGYRKNSIKGNYRADLTNPEEAKRFAQETHVDWLAVSVGNVHRMEKQSASIHFDLLAEIESAVDMPLVIHGSTGITDEDLSRLCRTKVAKVNIGTALRMAFGYALREEIRTHPDTFDRLTLMEKPLLAVEEEAIHKMELLGLCNIQW